MSRALTTALCLWTLPALATEPMVVGDVDSVVSGDLGLWDVPEILPDGGSAYVVGGEDAPQGRWPDTAYVDMGGGALIAAVD